MNKENRGVGEDEKEEMNGFRPQFCTVILSEGQPRRMR